MKKLLFLFDTDPYASVFDTVVAYDGGADRVAGYASVTPDNVGALVDGTIFTRGGKDKQSTAIFVGGSDIPKGEALFEAVKKRFFGPFRVSIMLDPNGSNTTAAAGVALLTKGRKLKGKKAVVLAGTGPVGMRAATFLAEEGADVTLTSRSQLRAENAARAIESRFGVKVKGIVGADDASRASDVKDANIVFAAGAIGVPSPQNKPTRSSSSATWNGFSRITDGLSSSSSDSSLYAEMTMTGDSLRMLRNHRSHSRPSIFGMAMSRMTRRMSGFFSTRVMAS
jgi:hypothetical protein